MPLMQYLDQPGELATPSILQELGCSLVSRDSFKNGHAGVAFPYCDGFEHNTGTESIVLYVSKGDAVNLEIRDSGDCWIQIQLTEHSEGVSLSPQVYRRVRIPKRAVVTESVVMYTSFSLTSEGSSNKKKGGGKVGKVEFTPRYNNNSDSVTPSVYHKTRELICELCRNFFVQGWVTGTGGSISIRHGNRIYMTPSGVQKERILPDELYVLDIDGNFLSVPQQKKFGVVPKLSDCSPLFLHAYQQRNAGAVLHSHSFSCNIITRLYDGEKEFRISHQEMIKGISGYGYLDELRVPIIDNTPHEADLAQSLGECIRQNPKTCAVLVRHHGIYVWGNSWEQAKRHGECLHYLFELAIQYYNMGLSYNLAPAPVAESEERAPKRRISMVVPSESCSLEETCYCLPITGATVGVNIADLTHSNGNSSRKRGREMKEEEGKRKHLSTHYSHLLFDIEGTTTPISFVKELLFPYSAEKVEEFLRSNNPKAPAHMQAIEAMARKAGTSLDASDKIKSLAQFVKDSIKMDLKEPPLKELQGSIWSQGYISGDLKSIVYKDVPEAFERMGNAGKKLSIYSSGSRNAQRLLFQYSNFGDLRNYLQSYFDTKVGHKRQAESYRDIAVSLGLEDASKVLFCTDIVEEAQAAKEAGMHAIILDREGNAPLPQNHGFQVITTFDDL